MSYLKRRIEKVEKKLNIGNERKGVFIVLVGKGEKRCLPEPLEEWITYKEAKVECGEIGIFLADPEAELKAREEQKATESNKKGEK
jgi:hypothetical protein